MISDKDYIIEISKLTQGHNDFEFDVNKELFDKFNIDNDGNVLTDVSDVNAKVRVDVLKEERMMTMRFAFTGCIQTVCARCLSPLDISVNKKTELYVKMVHTEGKSKVEEVDINEWVVDENENELNIMKYLYEELRVEIPIAPMHKDKTTCNQDVLNKLREINEESFKQKDEIDPRWEKLKTLIKE